MIERIEFYAKLYFQKIVPVCSGIAVLTLVILITIGKLNLVNYLNTLFIEAAFALIVAAIFSILSFFNLQFYKYLTFSSLVEPNLRRNQKNFHNKQAKNETVDKGVNTNKVRLEASVFSLIIGATLLLFLFIIHFGSKLFL